MTDLGTITGLDELPGILPVFPLTGALLLSTCQLPLNVFEPRYVDMVHDAMEGHRLIGMIQPRDPEDTSHEPNLYDIGCVGKICEFSELPNGIYRITLEGVCRFQIVEELANRQTKYRQVKVSYNTYHTDLNPSPIGQVNRHDLQNVLKHFLEFEDEKTDWDMLNSLDDDNLINSLSMICPFSPVEKQALLEAEDISKRGELLISLLTMMMQQGNVNSTLQ